MIAGPNFGVGSSREHAVWALVDYGFAAVISPRFGDIFLSNSTRSGLVPCIVSHEDDRKLMEAVVADPTLEITVDVERRVVEAPAAGIIAPFVINDGARSRLLQGLDDIGVTLSHVSAIDAFESHRSASLPTVAR